MPDRLLFIAVPTSQDEGFVALADTGPVYELKSPSEIASIAGNRAFGSKLITNIHRGLIVEAIVSTVLDPDWEWCSEDYYRCDFRHSTGTGLEVKQSAACQSWEAKTPSSGRWDISARKGFFEGQQYIERPGRNADINILAWHPLADRSSVDHRDPAQWEFFVVRSTALKATKTIGLAGVKSLTAAVRIAQLSTSVSQALAAHRQAVTDRGYMPNLSST